MQRVTFVFRICHSIFIDQSIELLQVVKRSVLKARCPRSQNTRLILRGLRLAFDVYTTLPSSVNQYLKQTEKYQELLNAK